MTFAERLDNVIREWKKIGYRSPVLDKMIAQHGHVKAVKILMRGETTPRGFSDLVQLNRPDLTLESIILEEPWQSLFDEAELKKARERLGKTHK